MKIDGIALNISLIVGFLVLSLESAGALAQTTVKEHDLSAEMMSIDIVPVDVMGNEMAYVSIRLFNDSKEIIGYTLMKSELQCDDSVETSLTKDDLITETTLYRPENSRTGVLLPGTGDASDRSIGYKRTERLGFVGPRIDLLGCTFHQSVELYPIDKGDYTPDMERSFRISKKFNLSRMQALLD